MDYEKSLKQKTRYEYFDLITSYEALKKSELIKKFSRVDS